MNVLFIGVGSIAKRHIRNLKEIRKDAEIDVLRSGIGGPVPEDINQYIRLACTEEEQLSKQYDAIFITNPTALHYDTLLRYNNKSDAFFIEKPVFVTGNEDISFLDNKRKVYYVAAPLRYTGVIQYLKENVNFTTVHSIRCISSSYLPDWRPGVDYRKTYSAHKEMGGGVSIDLIHEWDYIQYLAGTPCMIKSMVSRKSNLEINSDDIALYIGMYGDKTVELHLDYFGRKTIRKMELYTEADTIVADLVSHRIEWLVSGGTIDLSEERDSYQRKELQHFIDIIQGKTGNDNDIAHACRTIRIARGEA